MPKFSNWVKDHDMTLHDMFGHQIVLNFNKNGDSHTTFIGGFFSILVKVVMGISGIYGHLCLYELHEAF